MLSLTYKLLSFFFLFCTSFTLFSFPISATLFTNKNNVVDDINISSNNPYLLLGVSRHASQKEIRKVYRLLSKKYHPDTYLKDNDDKKNRYSIEELRKLITKINKAYDILGSTEKKKMYDLQGDEGVKTISHYLTLKQELKDYELHKESNSHEARNPLEAMFGIGGGSNRAAQIKHEMDSMKAQSSSIEVPVSLKSIYNGNVIQLNLHKGQILCRACFGTGADIVGLKKQNRGKGKLELYDSCSYCGGTGAMIRKMQIMPGFFQEAQIQCDKCKGTGKIVKRFCPVCKGAKTIKTDSRSSMSAMKSYINTHGREIFDDDKKSIEYDELTDQAVNVLIERGIPDEHQIVYSMIGEETPGLIPGDLVCNLKLEQKEKYEGPNMKSEAFFPSSMMHATTAIYIPSESRGEIMEKNSIDLIENCGKNSKHKDCDVNIHHFENYKVDTLSVTPEEDLGILKRHGDDLYYVMKLSLKEALLGFNKEITHLDGHKVGVKENGVIPFGTVRKIKYEGMPKWKPNLSTVEAGTDSKSAAELLEMTKHTKFDFGDLYIKYEFTFDGINGNDDKRKIIENEFPIPRKAEKTEEPEEHEGFLINDDSDDEL